MTLAFAADAPLSSRCRGGLGLARERTTREVRRWSLAALLALATGFVVPAQAQPTAPTAATGSRTVNDWLMRMHDASRQRAYMGTLVVTAGSNMSASRIWHVCDGAQQMERVDTLTGAARSTIRRNNEVITFVPESRTALVEKRESLGLFPDLLRTPANAIPEFYGVRETGSERVAGYLADVVEIVPRDALRFGYRVWSEKKTGLVVKLQTLGEQGAVLEQVAFSELQMDAPVSMEKLSRQMNDTKGYDVQRPTMRKTSLEKEGWQLKLSVPGFLPMSCQTREASVASAGPSPLQCVYSDGLASVSLFVETYDAQRHGAEKTAVTGATHSITRRIGNHWLTAMGEVPASTLSRFAQALERAR
ncbi:MAG: MucB/RseB C-terminal domain-containing protein [Hydrogenophaga sp.]|jgi:sigma-E factor negative regulatory protein RseB|nr:MucB/RseB C-terminal domain-containing protein [Hydrogenophaga sp.]